MSRDPARRPGFTLIEIILVLGLIVVASSIVVVNFIAAAERGDGDLPPEATLRKAIRQARLQAAREGRIVTLRYDAEAGALVLDGGSREAGDKDAAAGARLPLGEAFAGRGGAAVRFYHVAPVRGLDGFGRRGERAFREADQVRFAPDRSSSPFAVEIDRGARDAERVVYDPFSALPKPGPES